MEKALVILTAAAVVGVVLVVVGGVMIPVFHNIIHSRVNKVKGVNGRQYMILTSLILTLEIGVECENSMNN